jgi:hypothetical protein
VDVAADKTKADADAAGAASSELSRLAIQVGLVPVSRGISHLGWVAYIQLRLCEAEPARDYHDWQHWVGGLPVREPDPLEAYRRTKQAIQLSLCRR